MKQYRLSDGTLVPAVGFGTYLAGETAAALPLAVEAGYRYFDTAAYYFNEELVGKTLKDSGLKREEYQIASKVWHTELGYKKTTASFLASLKRLDCGYLDVFLIHWPRTKGGPEDWQTPLLGSWNALIDLQKQGLVHSIGVSNFLPHHLKVLEETGVAPVLDQLECHPGYLQRSAVDYCKQNGILVQAWSPLGRARVLQDPLLQEIARAHGVHPAIICLKWAAQRGQIPIPFSAKEPQYVSNLKCVTEDPLTDEEMETLRAADKNCRLIKGQVFLWPGATHWQDLWDLNGEITK